MVLALLLVYLQQPAWSTRYQPTQCFETLSKYPNLEFSCAGASTSCAITCAKGLVLATPGMLTATLQGQCVNDQLKLWYQGPEDRDRMELSLNCSSDV
jgi:hypothetical protein